MPSLIPIWKEDNKLKLRKTEERVELFCRLRKKWLLLTPEEWVRQGLINFLADEIHYPEKLMAAEKQVKVFDTFKRFDLLVYNRSMSPFLLAECKEPETDLTPDVLDQAIRYNTTLVAPYLAITNGYECALFDLTDTNKLHTLKTFPDFL